MNKKKNKLKEKNGNKKINSRCISNPDSDEQQHLTVFFFFLFHLFFFDKIKVVEKSHLRIMREDRERESKL